MGFGRGLGRVALPLAGRRQRIAEINLRLCFPELGEEQRRELLRRHFESLGMGLMELALAWWAPWNKIAPWLQVHGREHLDLALQQGRGVILFTAHFTSTELSGRCLAAQAPITPLYRPNENPLVERFVVRTRERGLGHKIIPRDDVRLMVRTLKTNMGVWFAPDQNFGHKGSLFSPFFGIAAATNTATSRFARMSGAPVLPVVTLRRQDGRGYDLMFEPPLTDFPSSDLQQDTDRINGIVERWARQAPEQYFWAHRRFKDRPLGETPFY
jgi:KDO2-lipid IV(A) lauroyltransferase